MYDHNRTQRQQEPAAQLSHGAELLPPDQADQRDASAVADSETPASAVCAGGAGAHSMLLRPLPAPSAPSGGEGPAARALVTLIPASSQPQRQVGATLPRWLIARWRRRPILTAAVALSLVLVLANVTVLAAHGNFVAAAWRAVAGAVGWAPTVTPTIPGDTWPTWNAACDRPYPPPPPPSSSYQPWAPPPPPLPVVPKQTVRQLIEQVFGNCAHAALVIAHCESNFSNLAWNHTPVLQSHAAGVFQILWLATWVRTTYQHDNAFDALANVNAAYTIFSYDGNRWFEWATEKCLPNGCSWCPGVDPS